MQLTNDVYVSFMDVIQMDTITEIYIIPEQCEVFVKITDKEIKEIYTYWDSLSLFPDWEFRKNPLYLYCPQERIGEVIHYLELNAIKI